MISNICKYLLNIATDKILHFLIAYIAFDILLSVGIRLNLSPALNIVISFVITILLLFAKEYLDVKSYGVWDWKDILAGYLGIILKLLVFLITIF